MNRNSTIVRYYLLVVAYSIALGSLLISVFVGVNCLSSAIWVWDNEYLAWVFGFGLGGLVLFGGTLLAGVCWRRSNLLVRPDLPEEQYKLFLLSIGSGIILIASLVTGMLTVGFSASTFGVYLLVPLTVLLWLFSAVRLVFRFKGAALPLLVNSVILLLVVLLQWTNRSVEFGFRWRLGGYQEVVGMVERGELRPNDSGFANLPADYQWLSDSGEIMIINCENLTSVIFFTQLEFPGEYYAIAYRSDDSVPINFNADRCDRGWRVQANTPQWYVCVSTRVGPD